MAKISKTFLLFFATLSGCAAPLAIENSVTGILNSECKELFVKGGMGSYQHFANQICPRAVFALSIAPDGSQKCAYSRNRIDGIDCSSGGSEDNAWAQSEAIAIARCDAVSSSIKNSCKVFARNNNIVWGKTREIDFK